MESHKKVLTILHSLTIGGIEKTLFHCMPGLQRENIEMTICCFSEGGNLEKEFRSMGVKLIYIRKTGSFLMDYFQLYSILKKNKFDVIHSRLSYTSGGFALAAKAAGIPFLVSYHNEFAATMIKWDKKFILSAIRKAYLACHKYLIMKYSTLIIGHSKSNLIRNFNGWEHSSKFKVLYNGVDFDVLRPTQTILPGVDDFFNKFSKDSFNIVHVGTFKEQKNHLFMIDSFALLDPIKNNYNLILIGDGELRKEIEKKIAGKGLSNNIHLIGYSKDIGYWLGKSDLFFFPSKFEGFANVMIEAQYSMLPICASAINPHFESVHSRYHKFFFDPYNVEDCSLKLQEMIGKSQAGVFNKDLKIIKEHMELNFSIERMAVDLAAIYKSV